MVFCLLDSQFWRRPSTNTLSSQSKFPLYFTLSLNWLCPVFTGLLPPELYIPGRHALSSNYSSSLKQFYTLVENFSNMFVAEPAVLSSVSYETKSTDNNWQCFSFHLLLFYFNHFAIYLLSNNAMSPLTLWWIKIECGNCEKFAWDCESSNAMFSNLVLPLFISIPVTSINIIWTGNKGAD
jgi:hypothetical protein